MELEPKPIVPVLRIDVMRSTRGYRFRLHMPPDTPAYSFRVLADLLSRVAEAIGEGVSVPRDLPDLETPEGAREWVFTYQQAPGPVAGLRTLESVRCLFGSHPTSTVSCAGALRAFVTRLLAEPDVDDPCFSGADYTMTVDA